MGSRLDIPRMGVLNRNCFGAKPIDEWTIEMLSPSSSTLMDSCSFVAKRHFLCSCRGFVVSSGEASGASVDLSGNRFISIFRVV
jgi:hypothetical protein